MIASTTLLNRIGAELATDPDVHGLTDVTGFGLLGHALEMARGAGVTIDIETARVPLLPHAAELARQGFATGASERNWASYGDEVDELADAPLWQRKLLTDPQTSGGLLVACGAPQAEATVARIKAAGYPAAARIGSAVAGNGRVRLR